SSHSRHPASPGRAALATRQVSAIRSLFPLATVHEFRRTTNSSPAASPRPGFEFRAGGEAVFACPWAIHGWYDEADFLLTTRGGDAHASPPRDPDAGLRGPAPNRRRKQ